MSDNTNGELIDKSTSNDNFKYKAGAFMAGVTGLSLLGGFGLTMNLAKKQDPEMFTKGIMTTGKVASEHTESGGRFALRALGRGTLYSVTGFSVFCLAVWKLMGVHSMDEFRAAVGGALPPIPRTSPPQGRTEFSGVRDLLQYLIDEDTKKAKGQGG